MLKLLIGRGSGDEETVLVAGREAPDDARPSDCGMTNGNYVLEFGFKDTARRRQLVCYGAFRPPRSFKLLERAAADERGPSYL